MEWIDVHPSILKEVALQLHQYLLCSELELPDHGLVQQTDFGYRFPEDLRSVAIIDNIN